MALVLCLSGCFVTTEPEANFPAGKVTGYRPVYGSVAETEIALVDPRPVVHPGKIYRYNNYLLINEKLEGIHVYNNADPTNPQPLTFIRILGNTDMSVKDNILYADHNGKLTAIRLNSFDYLMVLDAVQLTDWYLGVKPPQSGYFECIDQSKGIVIRWEEVELNNPECYAYAY